MAIIGGFDIHCRQVTFDYLDTVTGQVRRGRFEDDGLAGDRRWGIRDVRTGRILTARRRSELLGAAASCDGELPVITPADGCAASGPGQGTDGLLSRWLGSPVSLVATAGNAGGRAEYFADATDDAIGA
jgi:uncharacterized protein YcbX